MFKKLAAVLLLSFTITLALPVTASAVPAGNAPECNKGSFFGLPPWFKYLEADVSSNDCNLQFNIESDIPKVLLAVFEIVLRIAGLVAVGFVAWGGVQYVISQGEPEKAKGARVTIINALVGLVISIVAVTLVNLIGNTVL